MMLMAGKGIKSFCEKMKCLVR